MSITIAIVIVLLYIALALFARKKCQHIAHLEQLLIKRDQDLTDTKEDLKEAKSYEMVKDKTKAKSIQPGNRLFQSRKLDTSIVQVSPKMKADIDRMKRRNIQPGNAGIVPVGTLRDESGAVKELVSKENFHHQFFGTQLELGGRVLINGLPRRLHTLEILDGITYIDGRQIQMHPNDAYALIKQIKEGK